MNSHCPRDSRYRDGRILVTRDSSDAVRTTINRQIGTIGDLARATNPDAMPATKVTDTVAVYDLGTRSLT